MEFRRQPLIPTLCIAALAMGCASVSSVSRIQNNAAVAHEANNDGLVYYLPMRQVEAVFRREKVDLTEAAEAHKKAMATHRDAQSAMAAAESAMKQAKARTEALIKSGMSTTAEKYQDALLAEVDTALAYTRAAAAAGKARQALDDATAALASAETAEAQCGYVDTFGFTLQKPVADIGAKYILRMRHSILRNDEWSFKTTSQGLLSTVDSVNDDQSMQILVALAQARAAGGVPKMPKSIAFLSEASKRALPSPVLGCPHAWKPVAVRMLLDPANRDALGRFEKEVNARGTIQCKPNAPGCMPINILYRLEVDPATQRNAHAAITPEKGTNGVFYRRELPMNLLVHRSDDMPHAGVQAQEATVGVFQLVLPNASPAEHLPLNAGSFVKTHHALEFDQGMLVAVKSERPSEALRIASTPWEIAKATMGVLGEIVQFKVDYATQDAALIEQQTALLEQLRLQLEAQRELDAARGNDDP